MPIHVQHATIIYDPEADDAIRLCESGDCPGMLTVKTGDYYGKIDFSMDIGVAEAFADAIKKQCEFIRERIAKEGM